MKDVFEAKTERRRTDCKDGRHRKHVLTDESYIAKNIVNLWEFFSENVENSWQNLKLNYFEMSKFSDLKLESQTSDAKFSTSLTSQTRNDSVERFNKGESAGHLRAPIFLSPSHATRIKRLQSRFCRTTPLHVQQNMHNLKFRPSFSWEKFGDFSLILSIFPIKNNRKLSKNWSE